MRANTLPSEGISVAPPERRVARAAALPGVVSATTTCAPGVRASATTARTAVDPIPRPRYGRPSHMPVSYSPGVGREARRIMPATVSSTMIAKNVLPSVRDRRER